MVGRTGVPCEQSLSFACSILVIQERLCRTWATSLLSMRGMLLGYSFEPRPRALGTAGSVMTIGLSMNRCLHSKKNQFDERKQDWLVQKIGLRPRDSGIVCFSPFRSRRDKRRRYTQGGTRVLTSVQNLSVWITCYSFFLLICLYDRRCGYKNTECFWTQSTAVAGIQKWSRCIKVSDRKSVHWPPTQTSIWLVTH